jgi:hypothetical protein
LTRGAAGHRPYCIEEFLIFNPRMYHWSCRLLCEEEQVSGA